MKLNDKHVRQIETVIDLDGDEIVHDTLRSINAIDLDVQLRDKLCFLRHRSPFKGLAR